MNEIFLFFLQSDGEGGESSDNLDAEDSGSEVGDDGGNDNSLKRQVTKQKKKQLKFIKSPRGDFSRFQHKNGCAFESNCFVRCSPSFFHGKSTKRRDNWTKHVHPMGIETVALLTVHLSPR